jgi:hypothetical protein
MLTIYTPKKYKKIFKELEKLIDSGQETFPTNTRRILEEMYLWKVWRSLVGNENSDLGLPGRRKLALPNLIEYCQKQSTDIIIKIN